MNKIVKRKISPFVKTSLLAQLDMSFFLKTRQLAGKILNKILLVSSISYYGSSKSFVLMSNDVGFLKAHLPENLSH
jgi:hypothetical protein